MQDIADAAGVKPASLYNHIQSKQEILNELCFRIANIFTEKMNVIFSSKISSFKKIEKLIELHISLTIENPESMALITGEWMHLQEPHLTDYSNKRKDYENKFKKIIDECKNDGNIKKTLDTSLVLFNILSTLHWLHNWYNKNKINAIELEEQLKESLLFGLKVS